MALDKVNHSAPEESTCEALPAKVIALPPMTRTRKIRYICLLLANLYIVTHLLLWYGFDIRPWGKTAMMGVPSLIRGNINVAAVMVLGIIASVFIFGRAFCGWVCHIRGALELSDWVMRKLKLEGYMKLRRKNVLLNTRYSWLLRIASFFILLMPVFFYLRRHPYSLSFDMNSPPPWADLPGDGGLLFNAQAPFNIAVSPALADIGLSILLTLVIVFTLTFVFSFFYGQGAFCRMLCPYAFMLAIFSNLNPFQRRITRVAECTGCRKCSSNCPQGIDVSREIHHFNGKVRSRECIKCFTCVAACEHGVLKDTSAAAVPQQKLRVEYERRPWGNEFRNVQSIEPITPLWDFASMIFALICGVVASRLGGFWFYVGAIAGFLTIRLALRFAGQRKLTKPASRVPGKTNTNSLSYPPPP